MAEESAESIKQLKTTVIRASIHCQGCKRKVKKILSQVQGVEHVEIDAQQHKVTVTGNVDSDALVKKLIKSGKNAELWPQISQHKIAPANGKKKEKEIETQAKSDAAEAPAETSKKSEAAAPAQAADGGGGDAKAVKGDASVKTNGEVNAPVKKSEEEKIGEESCSAAPEKKEQVEKTNGGDGDCNGDGDGNGAKKKKKKKRGESEIPAARGLDREPAPATNGSPPRHHEFPPRHHEFPPPACEVSYNTAYPSSSYTASYYAAPPPHAYAYMHPAQQMEQQPPLDHEMMNQRQPLDSFEMFSDENPNGCFIM